MRGEQRVWRVAQAHDLTYQQAEMLLRLHENGDRYIYSHDLSDRLSERTRMGRDREHGDNLVRVLVHRLRRKLGKEAIETYRGGGYRLAASIRERVAGAYYDEL